MEELHAIARYQRAIIYCVLFLLIGYVLALFPLPAEVRLAVAVMTMTVAITAAVFVFLLALRVYTTGAGIALAIGTLIPCIGLLVLVVINSKATGLLREYGVRVGFLGVPGGEMARLKRWSDKPEIEEKL